MSHSLFEDSAARLFADHVDAGVRQRAEDGVLDVALWKQVVDSGFTQLLVAEAAGGIGETWTAAYPLLRGIGYWQVPIPLAETLVAAHLLSLAGLAVPDGPITLIEQGQGNTLQADTQGSSLSVSGVAHRVPWARVCPWVLLSLADGRLALLDLHASPTVQVQAQANHAGLPSDTVSFERAPVVAQGAHPLALAQPVWTLGAVARCAMMVGALEWVLEQSVQYAADRVQFGKPIGRNQALQQQLALQAGDAAAARMAALVAAADAPSSQQPDCSTTVFSAAVAKVRCGEAATRATGIAHQVHGAIGFTHEHALHFATRRLWAWREEFGSDAWWAQRLGRAAIQARGPAFWPSVTQRRFESGLDL
jgi:acyl-CoA dehydrogenase